MKTRLLVLLLLVAVVASYVGVGVVHERHTQVSRTFRFTPPGCRVGPPMHGGWYTDVIGIKRLPNGETEARIVVVRVLMADVRDVEIEGRAMQDITLLVTASQAETLDEAQNHGTLQYSLCRPEESKSMMQTVRDHLLGSRKVTVADLLKDD